MRWQYRTEDLKSANGGWVNGERAGRACRQRTAPRTFRNDPFERRWLRTAFFEPGQSGARALWIDGVQKPAHMVPMRSARELVRVPRIGPYRCAGSAPPPAKWFRR